MLNAFTIDLEDWAQSVIDPRLAISHCVVENTHRVLDWLRRRRIRATFFALGRVCEAYPDLLPIVAAEGHEIGSHGYGHELVFRLTPEAFAEDVRRSVEIIRQQIGVRPIGYRAPAFSITRGCPWAPATLSSAGFAYSSSVFPIRHRRYGIEDAPRGIFQWPDCNLTEFPISTVRFMGRNRPCTGGGYTRLLPAALMVRAIRSLNTDGTPCVVYMHPYEMAPGETRWFASRGVRAGWRRRMTQELWRSRVEPRLSRLAAEFEFAPMRKVLGLDETAAESSKREESFAFAAV